MNKLWHRLFLEERSSMSLSFFRMAVAFTTAAHVIPSFFQLADNYFPETAFIVQNGNFFPLRFLEWVAQSPHSLIIFFVWLFCISCFFFLIGFLSQLSCIAMTAACYYFYALNAFHIGTLSWDILLVTLFLMCLTSYHGDYFSIDCLMRGEEDAYKRRRPFFLQRLLQLQIGFTYFYTALYKVTAQGNWMSGNPIYSIMNYPPAGTTKWFLIRDFLKTQPELCYWIGILIVVIEILMIFLLFCPKTRISAIYLGMVFHITLILTLDVPAIFFFLFPAQLLLFINPDHIEQWIQQKRLYNASTLRQAQLIYDGHCQFCQNSVRILKIMDLFGTLKYMDLHLVSDLTTLGLSKESAMSQLHLIEADGKLYGGFDVFRPICFIMPMLYPMILIFYFPVMGVVGPMIYQWVAKNRYLFHGQKACQNNACFRVILIMLVLSARSTLAEVYTFGTNQNVHAEIENAAQNIFAVPDPQDLQPLRVDTEENKKPPSVVKQNKLEKQVNQWALNILKKNVNKNDPSIKQLNASFLKAKQLEREGKWTQAHDLYRDIWMRSTLQLQGVESQIYDHIDKENRLKAMREQADFYFQHGQYRQAKEVFEKLLAEAQTAVVK